MKKTIFILLFLINTVGVYAQLVNNGATITIKSATVTVNGDMNQKSGVSNNGGVLNVRGNLTQGGNFNQNHVLNLTGNLQANGSFVSSDSSMATFTNTTVAQQIGGGSAVQFGILRINNTAGILLNQNIIVNSRLDMTSRRGDLDLNGNIADLGLRGVILGESNQNTIINSKAIGYVTARRDVNNVSNFNLGNVGAIFSTQSDLGLVTLRRGYHSVSNCEGIGLSRYFDIVAQRTGKVNFSLTYFDREANGLNATALTMYRSTDQGANWQEVENTTSVANVIEAKQMEVTTVSRRLSGFRKAQKIVLNASATSVVCQGTNLELKADSIANANFEWLGPNGFRQAGRNVTIPYSQNLISGAYVLQTKLKGCIYNDTLTVKVSKGISFDIKTEVPKCFGSSNGKIIITTADTTLLFAIGSNPPRKGRTVTFDSLSSGMYSFRVRNADGCTDIRTLMINSPAKFEIVVIDSVVKVGKGRAVTLQAVGAQSYVWSPNENISDAAIANPIVTPTQTTTYKVVGKNANGCEATAQVLVTVIDENNVIPNKVISPNNDGIGDVWFIQNIDLFPDNEITIFNRWGQKVFETKNYQNTWGGTTQNGTPLPDGGYYYVIKLDATTKPLAGAINLVR